MAPSELWEQSVGPSLCWRALHSQCPDPNPVPAPRVGSGVCGAGAVPQRKSGCSYQKWEWMLDHPDQQTATLSPLGTPVIHDL